MTPGGEKVLIDGGPQENLMQVLPAVLPFSLWNPKIDLLILTHPQLDHLSGFIPLIQKYPVGRIILNETAYHLPQYEALLNLLKKNIFP